MVVIPLGRVFVLSLLVAVGFTLFLISFSRPASAQTDQVTNTFKEGQLLPGGSYSTQAIILTDLNGDGLDDVVLGQNDSNCRPDDSACAGKVFLNNGSENFSEPYTFARSAPPSTRSDILALAAVANRHEVIAIHENGESCIYQFSSALFENAANDKIIRPTCESFGGPGDLGLSWENVAVDVTSELSNSYLIALAKRNSVQIFRSSIDGNGVLQITELGSVSDISVGQVITDIDIANIAAGVNSGTEPAPDLIISTNAETRIYLGAVNSNNLNFTRQELTVNSISPDRIDDFLPPAKSVLITDLLEGGVPQIIVGNRVYTFNKTSPDGLTLNQVGIPVGGFITQEVTDVAVANINRDLKPDLILGFAKGFRVFQQSASLSLSFEEFTLPPSNARSDSTARIAVGRINSDNFDDLLFGQEQAEGLYYVSSDVSAPLQRSLYVQSCADITAVVVGDIDGDGRVDLLASSKEAIGRVDRPNRSSNSDIDSFTSNCQSPTNPTKLTGQIIRVDNTSAMALADLDNDNDLDLVVARSGASSIIYMNDGNGVFSAGPTLSELDQVVAVLAGDLDGDKDVDLVLGSSNGLRILLNMLPTTGAEPTLLTVQSDVIENLSALVLGDIDRDGDLDIIVGRNGRQSQVYMNDGRGMYPASDRINFGSGSSTTTGVAVGDLDGDGDLDIATSNETGVSIVYYNNPIGTQGAMRATFYAGPITGVECSINELRPLMAQFTCFSSRYLVTSVVIGDVNRDSQLDLVFGSIVPVGENLFDPQNIIYLNRGGRSFTAGRRFGSLATRRVHLADFNGDGGSEIIADNNELSTGRKFIDVYSYDQPLNGYLYVNVKRPGNTPYSPSYSIAETIEGPVVPISYTLYAPAAPLPNAQVSVRASYSLDGGGNWRPALSATGSITPNLSVSRAPFAITQNEWIDVSNGSILALSDDGISEPINLGFAMPFFGSSYREIYIASNGWLSLDVPSQASLYQASCNIAELGSAIIAPLWYDLNPEASGLVRYRVDADKFVVSYESVQEFDNQDRIFSFQVILKPDGTITFQYRDLPNSLNNATIGVWGATPFTELMPQKLFSCSGNELRKNLALEFDGILSSQEYVFYWDVGAARLFGQYDNVIFRIEAIEHSAFTGRTRSTSVASESAPFRLRGVQIRVAQEKAPASPISFTPVSRIFLPLLSSPGLRNTPLNDARPLVYLLRQGTISLLADGTGQPLRTNADNYLLGRTTLQSDDRLVALQPIAASETFTVYLSSAAPAINDLNAKPVTLTGTNLLTPSVANPLILFNLTVSVEWDAQPGDVFVERLQRDLHRVSALLYDWSNGQVALGDVQVFDAAEHWEKADIQILASNRVRPNATVGGLAARQLEGTTAGRIRIGPTWNRYGQPGSLVGDDWSAALAHELGHYAFALYDNYLGLESVEGGEVLVVDDDCTGPMNNPYLDAESEFRTRSDWLPSCSKSLNQELYRLADWDVMSISYPWLRAPREPFSLNTGNPGPDRLLLPLTKVDMGGIVDTNDRAIANPLFYLNRGDTENLSPGAEAYLFLCETSNCTPETVSRLIELGQPIAGEIFARGARVGDRLCVFDLEASDQNTDQPRPRLGCNDILRSGDRVALRESWRPEIIITPITGKLLQIEVKNLRPGRDVFARLHPTGGSVGKPIQLREVDGVYVAPLDGLPLLGGNIHVWVNEGGRVSEEAIVAYGLDGSPARGARGGATALAPALSPDGQVLIFKRDLRFDEGQFFTLQLSTPPSPPDWASIVGQPYRITRSSTAPSLNGASISFNYLERDLPATEEEGIEMYYYNEGAEYWEALPTKLDVQYNTASALMKGEGQYALMTSIHLPLSREWNSFAYSSVLRRPVDVALRSISGTYKVVLSYDESNPQGPWLVYDPEQPDQSTLRELIPGRGYLIYVDKATILKLRGGNALFGTANQTTTGSSVPELNPPAYFFGEIQGDMHGSVRGAPVIALINGTVCGQGQAKTIGGRVLYTIVVEAADVGRPECGAPGQMISFHLGNTVLRTHVPWSNEHPNPQTFHLSETMP